MEDVVLAMLFLVGSAACGLAAYTGARGRVTDPARGYKVPAEVRENPELARTANALVARWCAAASALSFIPVAALIPAIISDFQIPLPLWKLAGTAVYGMVVAMVAQYPFERIARM